MKKLLLILPLLSLTACQAPYTRHVYQATGPRTCVEYYNSFVCSAPQKMWVETVYPKNDPQMLYGNPAYIPYQEQSLNRAVYGTLN